MHSLSFVPCYLNYLRYSAKNAELCIGERQAKIMKLMFIKVLDNLILEFKNTSGKMVNIQVVLYFIQNLKKLISI